MPIVNENNNSQTVTLYISPPSLARVSILTEHHCPDVTQPPNHPYLAVTKMLVPTHLIVTP